MTDWSNKRVSNPIEVDWQKLYYPRRNIGERINEKKNVVDWQSLVMLLFQAMQNDANSEKLWFRIISIILEEMHDYGMLTTMCVHAPKQNSLLWSTWQSGCPYAIASQSESGIWVVSQIGIEQALKDPNCPSKARPWFDLLLLIKEVLG